MLPVTLLCTVDSKSQHSVVYELLSTKLAMDVCSFFIAKERVKLWVPASNTNAYALFDDTTLSDNTIDDIKFV